jgi:hypothetical protein
VGVRHALFPRILTFGAQLHPSSGRWLSVPRRCDGLHERLQSVPASQRGRSVVSPPRTVSGETSQLGFPRTCRCILSEPGPDASENLDASDPSVPEVGIGTLRLRSLALGDGSCLLPLKSRFWFSCGRLPVGQPAALRILSRLRGHHRLLPGAFLAECSIRGSPDPFSTFRLRHRTVSAAGFVRSKPPDDGPPHWLTVVTDRSCMTDCVRPRFRNHGTGGMTRLRGWFVGSVPLVCRITEPSPLAAWLPDRCRGNGTTHPEEAGDMCLRDSHSE